MTENGFEMAETIGEEIVEKRRKEKKRRMRDRDST